MLDITGGEGLQNIKGVRKAIHYFHFRSFLDYLANLAALSSGYPGEEPLHVRLDLGPFSSDEWKYLHTHYAGAKLLLTMVDADVSSTGAHGNSPTQSPEVRLQSIVDSGEVGVPMTTGLMIGIGENPRNREKTLRILSQIAVRYGHIRSILIHAFHAHSATPMADCPPPSVEEMLQMVTLARRIMPPLVKIQINALDWPHNLLDFVKAGANDLGDLSLKILSSHGKDAQMELSLMLEPLLSAGYACRTRSVLGSPRIAPTIVAHTA